MSLLSVCNLTNPIIKRRQGTGASAQATSVEGVTIVEQKDVGDFKTTTLTADAAEALVNWLQENNYAYSEKDSGNFEYYINQGGYFFVALKVNMEKARGVQMDYIRAARDKRLEDLDDIQGRAMGRADNAERARLEQEKQVLRDLPSTFDLAGYTTPQELKDAWPVELPPGS